MATLAYLRDRIIREVNREELTDAPSDDPTAATSATLDLCIQRAVEFYADDRFSFNEATTMLETVEGGNLVAYPSAVRKIDRLSVQVGGNRYALLKQDYTTLDQWQGYTAVAGQPTDYAVTTDFINLYPTPSQQFMLTCIGIVDVPIDYADEGTSNGWTNEAQDLIVARSKYLLFRDYFSDMQAAAIALAASNEAKAKLNGQTTIRVGTGRMRGAW